MSTAARATASLGVDLDRVTFPMSLRDLVRRRLDGRFPIDAFGADPQVQDVVAPLVSSIVAVDVRHAERIPRSGGALLVSNRGVGLAEPAVLAMAVRRVVGRRLRIVGGPDVPVIGGLVRKLGGISNRGDDVGVALRAGHLVAAPLAPTWLRLGAGDPPRTLLAAALGYPVLPVAVAPGGPFGLPLRPWRMDVGEPLEAPEAVQRGDPLAAAELAEHARDAVASMLRASD